MNTPIEHSRTYASANITPTRLHQAQVMWRRLKQLTQAYAWRRTGRPDSTSSPPPTRWRSEWHPKV